MTLAHERHWPMNIVERIRNNLEVIRQKCDEAAQRANRDASSVRLVGVTKYFGVDITQCVAEAGCLDLGENRPQQLWDKAENWTGPDVTWHMIGHLQRNKVARTLRHATWIHAGDSLRLLQEINRCAEGRDPIQTLLEVNVSGDEAKGGIAPDQLPALLGEIASLPNLRVRGLMTMAALHRRGEEARRDFAALRKLRDECLTACPNAKNIQLDELSMGMSGDYEVAIEEGATFVRVGSAIFEGVM